MIVWNGMDIVCLIIFVICLVVFVLANLWIIQNKIDKYFERRKR